MSSIEILLAGGGLVATGLMSVVIFILKDIFTKVGELGALRERVRTLENHADETKRLPEMIIRLDETVKNLVSKVEELTAKLNAKSDTMFNG